MNQSVKLVGFDKTDMRYIAEYFDKYFTNVVVMIPPETETFIEKLSTVREDLIDLGVSDAELLGLHKVKINTYKGIF